MTSLRTDEAALVEDAAEPETFDLLAVRTGDSLSVGVRTSVSTVTFWFDHMPTRVVSRAGRIRSRRTGDTLELSDVVAVVPGDEVVVALRC